MRRVARLFGAIALIALTPAAHAAFDLRVTEIWPGNSGDPDQTEDWFELTNFGDTAWTAATDGDLFFEDDSADASRADIMENVPTIGPGQSAVFVDGGSAAAVNFFNIWNPVLPQTLVGWYNGSGLSGGGDAVALFLNSDLSFEDDDSDPTTPDVPTVDPSELLSVTTYPGNFEYDPITNTVPANNGGRSYDVRLGEWSTVGNLNGAVSTLTAVESTLEIEDDMDVVIFSETFTEFGIGSPGQAPVPEPASVVLALVGLAATGLRYKRR